MSRGRRRRRSVPADDVLQQERSRARRLCEEALGRGWPLAEFELFGVTDQDAGRLEQLRILATGALAKASLGGTRG